MYVRMHIVHCTRMHTNIYHIYYIYIHILENPLHFCIFCITETFLQFCSRCTAEEITPAEGEIFWEDGEFCMALNYQWRKATETKKNNDPCTGDNDCDSHHFCCYDFWIQGSINSIGMFLGMVSMIQIRATGSPNEHATDATDPERGWGFFTMENGFNMFQQSSNLFRRGEILPLSHLRYLFRYIVWKKKTRNGFSLECRHMCNHVNTLSLVSTWHPRCWIGQKWACNMQEMFCWNLRGHLPANQTMPEWLMASGKDHGGRLEAQKRSINKISIGIISHVTRRIGHRPM